MADLIDRQAAIDALHSWERVYNWDETCREDKEKVYAPSDAIEALPTAEPEIVRCKDCKYYNPIGVCIEMSSAVCEDSFCCWAERRTDE